MKCARVNAIRERNYSTFAQTHASIIINISVKPPKSPQAGMGGSVLGWGGGLLQPLTVNSQTRRAACLGVLFLFVADSQTLACTEVHYAFPAGVSAARAQQVRRGSNTPTVCRFRSTGPDCASAALQAAALFA